MNSLCGTHLDEVDNHIPLATVADEVSRQVANQPVVNGSVGKLDGVLQEVVAFVQLVPEVQV